MNLTQWIPDSLMKYLPAKPAKYTKIICYITLGFFTLIGLGLGVHLLEESFGAFLKNVIYYIFLGCFASVVILYAFDIFARIVRKNTEEKMGLQYANQGFCMDMAETLKAVMPAPTDRDLVLRSFILVMSEHYKEAEQQIACIDQTALSMREFSMLMTAKIRLYMMTGNMEKARKLIEQNFVKMELAYENKPDLFDNYRTYADDYFEFLMLAAVHYDLIEQPDTAAMYRQKAEFQVSNRSTAELAFYKELMELNRLYVTGKPQAAHILENDLRGMVERFDPPLPRGVKSDLLRAAEQAKVFAAARIGLNTALIQQRKLPTQGGAALPADLVGM